MIDFSDIHRDWISFRELVESKEFQNYDGKLPIALGKNMYNKTVMCDLAELPHLLVGGSIKSAFNYPLLLSLIYKVSPDDMQLILIDPNKVELYPLKNSPHLMTPIVHDPLEAIGVFGWLVSEAERRHHILAENGVASIDAYNLISNHKTMPRIVIYVEELYYLMMIAPIEAEKYIVQIAEIGASVGIHMVLTTNRPRCIKPPISEKISAGIALNVNSSSDSQIIIGQNGAEELHINDLYFTSDKHSMPICLQKGFISTKNINILAGFFNEYYSPDFSYQQEIADYISANPVDIKTEAAQREMSFEELYEIVLDTIIKTQRPSVSFIQRETGLPFNEVNHIFDMLEDRNIIARHYAENSIMIVKTDINITAEEWEKQKESR